MHKGALDENYGLAEVAANPKLLTQQNDGILCTAPIVENMKWYLGKNKF